jgi:uncharacterized iron-regulated protein
MKTTPFIQLIKANPFCIKCALLFCLAISVAKAQLEPKNFKIYNTATKSIVNLDSLVNNCAQTDVIFFGEEHNDSIAHLLEAEILRKLHGRNANICLSLEMFERDVQPTMNDYLNGLIREKNFLKDCRVWSNYKDYKPLVEFAKTNKLKVVCANAPGRYSNMAGRLGPNSLRDIDPISKNYIAPLPYAMASGGYYDKLKQLTSHRNDSAPAPAMMNNFNLIAAQSLWDATMAYSISQCLKENKKSKVFQVNGRFHSDEFFAIVTQLKTYRPKTKCVVISCFKDDNFETPKWDEWAKQGNFIIVTNPAIPPSFD